MILRWDDVSCDEDDLSTPDDTYRPAARRKPKKKTKAIPEKAETENNRNLLYLIAGISVLGVCFLGGIGYVVVQMIGGEASVATSRMAMRPSKAILGTDAAEPEAGESKTESLKEAVRKALNE